MNASKVILRQRCRIFLSEEKFERRGKLLTLFLKDSFEQTYLENEAICSCDQSFPRFEEKGRWICTKAKYKVEWILLKKENKISPVNRLLIANSRQVEDVPISFRSARCFSSPRADAGRLESPDPCLFDGESRYRGIR